MSHCVHIRTANEADLDHVIDLAVEAVLHSISHSREISGELVQVYRRQDLQALRSVLSQDRTGIFVAEDEKGQFLGHVIVSTAHQDSSTGEIQAWVFDLAVVEKARGRGIGRRLMARAEEFALARGVDRLGLGVTLSNRSALEFYRRLGYVEERVQMIKKIRPSCP